MDASAKELFDSLCLMFNCRSNKYRRGNNADLAAEEGIECLYVIYSMCECEWPARMHCCIAVYVVCAIHRHRIYTPAGISPWKIGMLAANLFLWDIMWKRIDVPAYQEEWQVGQDHIERAYTLMTVFAKTRTTYTTHMPITCMLCTLCRLSHTSIAYHRRGVALYIECVAMRTSYCMFTSQDRIHDRCR